jgi:hypothetical protein
MAQSKQLKRLMPWHHRLIDWMLLNPQASNGDIAQQFGKSPVWISLILNSPVFRAELDRRSDMLSHSIAERLCQGATALANHSLEELSERLDRDRNTMHVADVRETAALALQYLGYPRR